MAPLQLSFGNGLRIVIVPVMLFVDVELTLIRRMKYVVPMVVANVVVSVPPLPKEFTQVTGTIAPQAPL